MKFSLSASAAAATFLIAGAAAAAPMTYTDRATFEAAIGGSNGSENFNSVTDDASFRNMTVVAGNMSITGDPGITGDATNNIDAPPLTVGYYDIDGTSQLIGDVFGPQQIRFDFLAEVTAWGADFLGVGDGERATRMDFFTAGDVLIGSLPFSGDVDELKFFGIDLDGALAAYAILGFNTGGNDVFGMDNVAYLTSEVPLPAAAPVFLAGLAGLRFARRRKAAAAR